MPRNQSIRKPPFRKNMLVGLFTCLFSHIPYHFASRKLIYKRCKSIRNLVFSGGSLKGFAHLGALDELSKYYDWDTFLSQITKISGSSAGCTVATFVASNTPLEKALEFALTFPVSSIVSNCPSTELILSRIVGSFRWTRERLNHIPNYNHYVWSNRGLSTYAQEICKICVDGNPHVTFAELYAKTKKELIIYATDWKKHKVVEFSYQSYPDVSIWKAMAASMALPIVFEPVTIDGVEYIDGGIMQNVPVSKFEPGETLYFKLISHFDEKTKESTDIIDYIAHIIECMFEGQESAVLIQNPKVITQTIFIECVGTGLLDVLKTKHNSVELENIIRQGRTSMKQFIMFPVVLLALYLRSKSRPSYIKNVVTQ